MKTIWLELDEDEAAVLKIAALELLQDDTERLEAGEAFSRPGLAEETETLERIARKFSAS